MRLTVIAVATIAATSIAAVGSAAEARDWRRGAHAGPGAWVGSHRAGPPRRIRPYRDRRHGRAWTPRQNPPVRHVERHRRKRQIARGIAVGIAVGLGAVILGSLLTQHPRAHHRVH